MEQQEQRDKLQVLHKGQEMLRRNINMVRRSCGSPAQGLQEHGGNTGKKRCLRLEGRHDLKATMEPMSHRSFQDTNEAADGLKGD
jgi:hypothetical protein